MASASDRDPLSLLDRYARQHRLGLMLSRDFRCGGRIQRLGLVEPNRWTVGWRKHKLRSGRLVASVDLADGMTVHDAARLLVEQLAHRVATRRAGV